MVIQVIGKVLLAVLIVLAVLIALLLFLPICYSGKFTKHGDEIHADGRIWWLFHAVHASGFFNRVNGKNTKDGEVRIFGFPLIRMMRRHRNPERTDSAGSDSKNEDGDAAKDVAVSAGEQKKPSSGSCDDARQMPAGRRTDGSAKKKPTAEPGRWKYMPDDSTEKPDMKVGVYHRKEPTTAEKIFARIAAFFGKLKRKIAGLGEKLRKIDDWLIYLDSESFGRVKDLLIRQAGGILRYILPRKISGYLEFGTGDPASAGQILGVIAVFYPVIPQGLEIRPDFMEKKLEADTDFSGHIFLIVVLVRALKILLNRDFRALRKRIKASRNGSVSAGASSEDRDTGGKGIFRRRKKDARKAA